MDRDLDQVLAVMDQVKHLIAAQREDLATVMRDLEDLVNTASIPVEQGVQNAPPIGVVPTAHRAAHRPGRPSRLDRMTFTEIADDVANHFPKGRRVSRSTIHAWWKKRKRCQ